MNCSKTVVSANVTDTQTKESVEYIWHCRFGHLGSRNLEKLAKDKLVCGFNYELVFFVNPALMAKFIKSHFQLLGSQEQTSHLSLFTVMFVVRFGTHLSVDVIIFLPLLMTILGMCGYTF